jgi:hypothetical protein
LAKKVGFEHFNQLPALHKPLTKAPKVRSGEERVEEEGNLGISDFRFGGGIQFA